MGVRRKGRELALQALYQLDVSSDASEASLRRFWEQCEASARAREFASELVAGVLTRQEEIDRLVEEARTTLDPARRIDPDQQTIVIPPNPKSIRIIFE